MWVLRAFVAISFESLVIAQRWNGYQTNPTLSNGAGGTYYSYAQPQVQQQQQQQQPYYYSAAVMQSPQAQPNRYFDNRYNAGSYAPARVGALCQPNVVNCPVGQYCQLLSTTGSNMIGRCTKESIATTSSYPATYPAATVSTTPSTPVTTSTVSTTPVTYPAATDSTYVTYPVVASSTAAMPITYPSLTSTNTAATPVTHPSVTATSTASTLVTNSATDATYTTAATDGTTVILPTSTTVSPGEITATTRPVSSVYVPSTTQGALMTGTTDVYLGLGCFWESQYSFTNIETDCSLPAQSNVACTPFNRAPRDVTSRVGYAGGKGINSVPACYDPHMLTGPKYSKKGHTEVTSVTLDNSNLEAQFSMLLKEFFGLYKPTPMGMARPDQQMDIGPGYRSAIGIPDGVNSPLYDLVKKENLYNMKLVEGYGNEQDQFNTVYIYDSNRFPFQEGEMYHQFHTNFFGFRYPEVYVWGLYNLLRSTGDLTPHPVCAEGRPHE